MHPHKESILTETMYLNIRIDLVAVTKLTEMECRLEDDMAFLLLPLFGITGSKESPLTSIVIIIGIKDFLPDSK
jgi:hypothetical protein